MSFDEILDLTADVFSFYYSIRGMLYMSAHFYSEFACGHMVDF